MTDTDIGAATTRLAAAAEALEQAIARISASHESLHTKIDRIIAAIDERALSATEDLERRITALERENGDLKAAAEQHAADLKAARDGSSQIMGSSSTSSPCSANSAGNRKTLAPFVSMLLSKSGTDDASISADAAILDKALASLSVEQRVAVKAEMARAGLIA